MNGAVNIDDLRKLAKKRLPRFAYDFIEGGAEDEIGLATNERAFRDERIVPRCLIDVAERDQATTLFGRAYAGPIGIAPIGFAGVFRHGADIMLAEAARDARAPIIMSCLGSASLEELGRLASGDGWYQLYISKERSVSEDMIRRGADAGFRTLVFTVDVPVVAKRERNLRNGWHGPLKLSWRRKLEALLRHPAWAMEWLRHGAPMFENWRRYAGVDADVDVVAAYVASQYQASMSWSDVERFRRLWKGNLVLKGIMHPDDALRAASLGVDGVIVSNHGGRQLDLAPSPLAVLPAIRDAVGDKMALMMDGGIRRGADAVVALCLGAEFVFVGRPTLYGVAAGGAAGAKQALDILRHEVDLTMGQMGAARISDLGPEFLLRKDA